MLAKALEINEDELKEKLPEPKTESINYQIAKYINLSSILGVFFFPLNILLPWSIMWYKKEVNKITKQIVSLQIMYSIIAFVCIGLSPFIYKWFGLTRQLVLITITLSVLVNLFIIIRNTIELDKNKKLYFKLNFNIL